MCSNWKCCLSNHANLCHAEYGYSGRYPGSDYMRSAGDYYGMGGYGESRSAGAGYAAAAASYGAYRYPTRCVVKLVSLSEVLPLL